MPGPLTYAATAAAGYLAGSVMFAPLVARRHGVDLGAVGDGNPGAWNALEALGPRRAWPVFAGDGLKGTLGGLTGLTLGGGDPAPVYVGVGAAMLGHCFPLFHRFAGGKAIMTFAGGGFVIAPAAASASLALCVAAARTPRGLALGAKVGVFAFPVLQLLEDDPHEVAATGALMTLIGLRFLADRRSGRAIRAGGAPPPASG